MVNNKLKLIAENYFGSLNPIAARIQNDIKEIQLSYDNLWGSLKSYEQNEIIDESIIKPEIALQYALLTPTEENNISFDEGLHCYNSNLVTGQKIVQDENFAYRDEHSAPFNMKTASQLNLNVFEVEKITKPHVKHLPGAINEPKQEVEELNNHESSKPDDSTIPKIIKPPNEAKFLSELKSRTQMKGEESIAYNEMNYLKDENIIPDMGEINLDTVDSVDTIKTGYDFLDNW